MDELRRSTKDGRIAPDLMGNFTHLDIRDIHAPLRATPFSRKKREMFFSTVQNPLQFEGINKKLHPDPPAQVDCIEYYAKKRVDNIIENENKKEKFEDIQQKLNEITFNDLLIVIAIFIGAILLITFRFMNVLNRNMNIIAQLTRGETKFI